MNDDIELVNTEGSPEDREKALGDRISTIIKSKNFLSNEGISGESQITLELATQSYCSTFWNLIVMAIRVRKHKEKQSKESYKKLLEQIDRLHQANKSMIEGLKDVE